jgi:uncharacterized protein with HEPN domain
MCATGFFARPRCFEGRSALPAPHAGALPPRHRFIGPGRETFLVTEGLQDAVIRNLEVIGEAAKRVSAEARARLSQLDWKANCGMRDVLIHDYIGVDLDEVWNVASARIPELQAVLEQFLAGEGLA